MSDTFAIFDSSGNLVESWSGDSGKQAAEDAVRRMVINEPTAEGHLKVIRFDSAGMPVVCPDCARLTAGRCSRHSR